MSAAESFFTTPIFPPPTEAAEAARRSICSSVSEMPSSRRLVGIPTLKLAITYEGLGFCVPINTVKSFIDQIIATGKVSRPMLGIGVQDYDGPEEATAKRPPKGVMVVQVAEGSSAAEQGLRVYDVITEIDGVRITGYNELTAEIDKHKLGDAVEIKAYRYYDRQGDRLDEYEEHVFRIELRTYE